MASFDWQAHSLALTAARTLDKARQRGLICSRASGLAVGVHTQFAIRDCGLYGPTHFEVRDGKF